MSGQIIAVYGATGHTAKFVLRELRRRGFAVAPIGRSPAPPRDSDLWDTGTEWRCAPCEDPDALDAALRGTSAVINCAGPFLDTAPALIEAALRASIHYFDITAEQRSVRQTLATFHAEARDRGTVVVPAMAFYGGLADLLAAEVTHGFQSVDSVAIGVALDYWHPTEGTRKTGARNTARRLFVADGRLKPLPQPAPVRDWIFPQPFGALEMVAVPLSEIITINRHIVARNVCSYMNSAPLRDLEDLRTPAPTTSDPTGQSSQRFALDVHAKSGSRQAQITATGHDIYAITAPIVVEACMRIVANPPAVGGTYAPGELFDSNSFLSALEPHLNITRGRPRFPVAHV